ncbi:hypothetical protein G647_02817 [Cladophialophora carrionii CBS 160.54]|uniref:BTB domain-containing protein n=1 Tax=Cladophialophora carrionii CBS 160.54 TaxID=1279043 RepID=V9DGR1_9EURO|nr:uncharacterized protein G647_02817 [Cladophialophora carrionii CBS 160.54]ETI26040.1 hypothetical protein G647_02817 [Cladophialophora carrionii CBS 160.54]
MSRRRNGRKVSVDEPLRQDSQEALFVPEFGGDAEATEIGRETFRGDHRTNTRKRRRVCTERKSTATTASMNSPLQSPIRPKPAGPRPSVRIKSEAESQALADLRLKASSEKVRIYVGANNTVYEVGLEDLDKAAALKALVNKTGTQTPFIMHPELTEISADHFHSVYEFLLTHEYMPAIIDNPLGENRLPKRLDGCTSAAHYQEEALRGAHLYVIAKRIGLKSMQDLVVRKITQAQHQPYDVECLLGIAMIVFSRPEANAAFAPCNSEITSNIQDSGGDQDVLEEWLVQNLGDKLQPLMINYAQLFFEVANHGACAARGFGARVLRRKVEFWDTVGADVIAIEDDE